MTQRQRENIAKYLYDLSKIVFATAVLGNLIAGKQFDVVSLIWGTAGTWLLSWWGYVLDGVRNED